MKECIFEDFKSKKLPGPLSRPWSPAANSSLHSHNSTVLCQQLLDSEAGAPLTKSWICTCSSGSRGAAYGPKFSRLHAVFCFFGNLAKSHVGTSWRVIALPLLGILDPPLCYQVGSLIFVSYQLNNISHFEWGELF